MGVTASELASIVAALRPRLVGARVRKVHQPRRHELVLGLRAAEGPLSLLLNLHPRHARIHLLASPRRNPPSPPPFAMALRRDLDGARIMEIETLGGDRVVAIDLRRGPVRFRLVGELFGGRAALVLVADDGRVHTATRTQLSGNRNAIPGEPYVLPDPRPGPPAPPTAPPEEVHRTVAAREEEAEERLRLEEARRIRDRALAREQKKLEKLARRLDEDVTRLPDPDLCRRRGTALRSALAQVPRGASEVTLTEWTDRGARPITVPLDPRRGARANMERWFHRARRSERASEHIARRLEETRHRLEEIARRRVALRTAEDPEALEPAPEPPQPAPRARAEPSGVPCFTSAEGLDILVGRSAEENDRLTFRLARGGDTWLHVRDRPGAHVVIRTPRGRSPSLETLLDAAVLAVHHSSARDSSGVEVSYTLRKYVRRMRGAPRGTVSISGERSLRVDPDASRLSRLYETRREVTSS